jgi:hypothetical protein
MASRSSRSLDRWRLRRAPRRRPARFRRTVPVGLLVGVIIIVGLLTYFPALALGPIVEHFLMFGGKTF